MDVIVKGQFSGITKPTCIMVSELQVEVRHKMVSEMVRIFRGGYTYGILICKHPLIKTARKWEEKEEEVALPLDMLDEDDLKLMEDLAQKASFLTRDLSSK